MNSTPLVRQNFGDFTLEAEGASKSTRESPDIDAVRRFALYAVDATGLAHAMILRIQTLLLPIQTLALGGH